MASIVIGATSLQHLPRWGGIGLGIVVVLMGVVLLIFHQRLTRAFNALYAELPGAFQYPRWFVRVLGGIFATFGAIVVALSAALGH